ncbi:VanZ family protein [Arthrobacter sp. D3-16]
MRPSADGKTNLKHLYNRGLWQLILAAMLVPLALIAFWPSPVDQPVQGRLTIMLQFLQLQGFPNWFNYKFLEATANLALFVPFGLVSALAFPNKSWWQIGALGLLTSGCIELGQFLFLYNRFASPLDLVTNALGAVIGVLIVAKTAKAIGASPRTGSGT